MNNRIDTLILIIMIYAGLFILCALTWLPRPAASSNYPKTVANYECNPSDTFSWNNRGGFHTYWHPRCYNI